MKSSSFAKSLGNRIQLLRTSIGMSQEELATRLGYSGKSIISKIESGKSEPPASKLFSFAEILGTNIAYLMGWDDSLRSLTQEDFDLIRLFKNSTQNGRLLALGNLQASQQDTDSTQSLSKAV